MENIVRFTLSVSDTTQAVNNKYIELVTLNTIFRVVPYLASRFQRATKFKERWRTDKFPVLLVLASHQVS